MSKGNFLRSIFIDNGSEYLDMRRRKIIMETRETILADFQVFLITFQAFRPV